MYVLQESRYDWLLVGLVAAISIAVSTHQLAPVFSIDDRYLIIGLSAVITIGIVRYFRFSVVVLVSALAVGANLPAELAERLGVSTAIMLATLAVIVVVSMANQVYKKLPTGIEDEYIAKKPEGCGEFLKAINLGDLHRVKTFVENGIKVNSCTVYGTTPLMFATNKGYYDIAKYLLDHGANPRAKTRSGDTALSLAERFEFDHIADLIRAAELSVVSDTEFEPVPVMSSSLPEQQAKAIAA
jgi:hypothetical protein